MSQLWRTTHHWSLIMWIQGYQTKHPQQMYDPLGDVAAGVRSARVSGVERSEATASEAVSE